MVRNKRSGIKLQNRLKDWRHILKMEKGEFANFLDVNPSLYSQWENHGKEPLLESAWQIVQKIREHEIIQRDNVPCHIEDLYEEVNVQQ